MSRKRWVCKEVNGKPELMLAEEYYAQQHAARAPYIIADEIHGGLWNPADDKVYTSKHKYDDAVRRAGCVIKGNEKLPPHKLPDTSKEWIGAIRQACDIHNVRF